MTLLYTSLLGEDRFREALSSEVQVQKSVSFYCYFFNCRCNEQFHQKSKCRCFEQCYWLGDSDYSLQRCVQTTGEGFFGTVDFGCSQINLPTLRQSNIGLLND